MSNLEKDTIWGDTEASDIQIILLMRLYDISMSKFIFEHPEEGQKLYDLHCEGGFLNPPPAFDPDNIIS